MYTEAMKRCRTKYRKKYYARTAYAENHRKPWETFEMSLILKHEQTDTELAYKLGRSVSAIQMKRGKLLKTLTEQQLNKIKEF